MIWRTTRQIPALAADEVQVWRFSLQRTPGEVAALSEHLIDTERARAERFRLPADRARFIVGRGLLRTLLAGHLHQHPGQLDISYASAGKPMLADDTLRFNLTHSGDLALLAITRQRDVGIDLELMRDNLDLFTIADRFFAPKENAHLRAQQADRQRETFYRTWTRKEAYMKATGLGLSMALDQFAVLPRPGSDWLRLELQQDHHQAASWALRDLDPGPGFVGAIAVAGHNWHLTAQEIPGEPGQ